MKTINLAFGILALGLVLMFSLESCNHKYTQPEYPQYSITTKAVVPDSLREDQRKFVVETVRAASQHMTGGDYEDVDDTIDQARLTSEDLFSIEVQCLYKIDGPSENGTTILPQHFTSKEKEIFRKLTK